MSLAMILHPPPTGERGFNEWTFSHLQDHLDIVQKIQAATGIVLPTYAIDPFRTGDDHGWLLKHQQFHNDIGAVLGIDNSDLQTVDWKSEEERESWFYLNVQEHRAAHARLGS